MKLYIKCNFLIGNGINLWASIFAWFVIGKTTTVVFLKNLSGFYNNCNKTENSTFYGIKKGGIYLFISKSKEINLFLDFLFLLFSFLFSAFCLFFFASTDSFSSCCRFFFWVCIFEIFRINSVTFSSFFFCSLSYVLFS